MVIPFSQPVMEVKYSGVLDIDYFYSDIRSWFSERELTFTEFMHKAKPPELEFTWIGERKDTDFKRTEIKLFFHAWYIKNVEVDMHGKKKKMIDTSIQVKIHGKHEIDYRNRFEKNAFTRFLFKFLMKYVMFYKVIIMEGDDVYYEMLALQKRIRKDFDMSLKGGAY